MTLLNIEPLSINTHTQTSPALQFPQASATRPPGLPASSGQTLLLVKEKGGSRKEGRKGKHTYRERGNGCREKYQRKRKKEAATWEKMRRSGVKWEETEDKLSVKCARCMLQFTAGPPLRLLSLHPSLCMSTAFGNRPKDIPFFSLAVPRINRHEAAELLLLHHISLSRVQIKLFLLSGAHSGAKKKKKKKKKWDSKTEGGQLLKINTDRPFKSPPLC